MSTATVPEIHDLLACSSMKLTSSTGNPYWFRTLDYKTNLWDAGAHLVSFPKHTAIPLTGQAQPVTAKHAILGMTYNTNDTWLLDGINSAGVLGGLLFLYEGTSVPVADADRTGVVGLEVLTALLASCATVAEVCERARTLHVLDIPIRQTSVPSTLHYIFLDSAGASVVLEAADPEHPGVFQIHTDRQTGILTNSPPYPKQLENLSWYLSQSPELRCGGPSIPSVSLDETTISADAAAAHWCLSGTFPATYTSYDRFVRLAMLKALNHNGRDFSDEQMLPFGMGLMRSVFEPHNQGLYHYVRWDNGVPSGQGDGYTQYTIIYDLKKRCLYLQPYDTLAWTAISLGECCETAVQHHAVCRDAGAGILRAESSSL